nr:hypothetical protein 4 [bacterium]
MTKFLVEVEAEAGFEPVSIYVDADLIESNEGLLFFSKENDTVIIFNKDRVVLIKKVEDPEKE